MVRFIHCFRSICVGYSVRAGLFYLYFPVRECDRMWCLACVYCRPSCAACISGYGGDVAVGYLVWGFISGVNWSSCTSFYVIFELGWSQHFVYQTTDGKRLGDYLGYFRNSNFTVWTKCCGHFVYLHWNCFKHLNFYNLQSFSSAVKKLVSWICIVVVWRPFIASDNILIVWHKRKLRDNRKLLGGQFCLLWKNSLLSKIIISTDVIMRPTRPYY